MTTDPHHLLRCTAAELDLLDEVARRHLSARLFLEEVEQALGEGPINLDAAHADLTAALHQLRTSADQLSRAYAAARGHIYDLPTRKDER